MMGIIITGGMRDLKCWGASSFFLVCFGEADGLDFLSLGFGFRFGLLILDLLLVPGDLRQ
jgi:hypothetical protein